MNNNEIHFVGLVGLRALAEYNPSEFKRSTDMTKAEIEYRLLASLHEANNENERLYLYRELKNIIENTDSQIESGFLLQQLYFTCLREAQYYSLQNSKVESKSEREDLQFDRHYYRSEKTFSNDQQKELIGLSVMLMLRSLPDYSPIFNYRLGSQMIDCVLEPQRSDLSYILIEARSTISRIKQFNNAVKQIKSVVDIFSEKSIGIIVVESFPLNLDLSESRKNIHLLIFDVRRNRFINDEFSALLKLINDIRTNSF